MKPIVIIGAGLDGLIAAYYLAKAGHQPLVLERRELIGGACATEEFHPGFRASLSMSAGSLLPQIVADLQLPRHGCEISRSSVWVTGLDLNGGPVCIYEDAKRTAAELASARDREQYPEFISCFDHIGRALRPLLTMTPPNIDEPSKSELWDLGKLGWKIRGLGKKDEYRFLRYGPMAVADLAAEWFENELLRAVIAARGIYGAFAGPWSAGTSLPLLLQAAIDGRAVAPSSFVKGGLGKLSEAIAKAATRAGAEIRTGVKVTAIEVRDGRAVGIMLESGETIPALATISNCDPAITLLQLIDAGELAPSFRTRVQNYRAHGTVARIDLALSASPSFVGVKSDAEALSGHLHIGSDIDYLERAFDAAKYGEISQRPYMDITIPTTSDPSLAPSGAHVMSIHAQFAPYRLGYAGLRPAETSTPEARVPRWDSRREELGDTIVNALSDYAPDLKRLIVARRVLTPLDLEMNYGFRGGHIHHGEMSVDQFFAFRPMIGCAQYRTPVEGLYLCGAGTHPGSGLTGASGLNASREMIRDLKR
jgi:phytoene dehydrogenase-like protein